MAWGEHITLHHHYGHGPSMTSDIRKCRVCGQRTVEKEGGEMALPPRSQWDQTDAIMRSTGAKREKVPCPKEITIKWLIERDACKEGMLDFLYLFPGGTGIVSISNFALFKRPSQEWLREQIEGPLPWETKEFHRQKGLAKLTREEKEALGIAIFQGE